MKRQLVRGLCVGSVVAVAWLAALIYRADSVSVDTYRPAVAVALETDGATTEIPYNYRAGDRLCSGSTPGAIDPGSLTVYYDPKDPCTSVTTSPADKRFGDQVALFFGALNLAGWVGFIRLSMRQPEEMTWQPS